MLTKQRELRADIVVLLYNGRRWVRSHRDIGSNKDRCTKTCLHQLMNCHIQLEKLILNSEPEAMNMLLDLYATR